MKDAIAQLIKSGKSYSFGAVARALGVNPSTVWRWHLRGKLPSTKIGGRRYCSADDLREFVARCNAGSDCKHVRSPAKTQRSSQAAGKKLEKVGW